MAHSIAPDKTGRPDVQATHWHCYRWSGSGQEWERLGKTDTLDLNSPDRPPVRTVDWLIKSPRFIAAVHAEPAAARDWLIAEWDQACEKEWLKPKGVVQIERQVKLMRDAERRWVQVFAPPKHGRIRQVRLSESVRTALSEHARHFPPVEVTLPWERPDGDPVTVRLFFTSGGRAAHRTSFNYRWRVALRKAGIVVKDDTAEAERKAAKPRRKPGGRGCPASGTTTGRTPCGTTSPRRCWPEGRASRR